MTVPTLRLRLATRAFFYALAVSVFVGITTWLAVDRVISDRIELEAEDYLATLLGELAIATSPTDDNVIAPMREATVDRAAQIINLADGDVIVASPGVTSEPMVDPARFAGESAITAEAESGPGGEQPLLIKAVSATVGDEIYGVVAAVYSDSPHEDPYVLIAVGGVALIISVGLGIAVWASVRAALRPVERLADEADQVAASPDAESWTVTNVATTAEIHQLIERLNSLVGRVQESRERERTFLEDASHDLRTPITVARAELDLARENTTEHETRQALDSAIEELDRLDRLAADLLILASMQANPDRPTEPIHLGNLIRRAAGKLVRSSARRSVKVTVTGQAEIRGDPMTLERGIDNVLTNAFRHAVEAVAIEIQQTGDEACVRITDDGPGFPQALLGSAAERFTREAGHAEGTGLGLAIATAITEAHGGRLEFMNLASGGAVVTLRFPIDHESPEARPAPAGPPWPMRSGSRD